MWESPINMICGELQMHLEGETLKAVQNVGVDVNKEELIKALNYDRNQYGKGYKDGYANAIEEFISRLENHTQENWIDHQEYGITWSDIEMVAEKLKGNEFFNFDSPVVNIDKKSYIKGIDEFVNALLNYQSQDEDYKSFSDVCYEIAEQLKGEK